MLALPHRDAAVVRVGADRVAPVAGPAAVVEEMLHRPLLQRRVRPRQPVPGTDSPVRQGVVGRQAIRRQPAKAVAAAAR